MVSLQGHCNYFDCFIWYPFQPVKLMQRYICNWIADIIRQITQMKHTNITNRSESRDQQKSPARYWTVRKSWKQGYSHYTIVNTSTQMTTDIVFWNSLQCLQRIVSLHGQCYCNRYFIWCLALSQTNKWKRTIGSLYLLIGQVFQ